MRWRLEGVGLAVCIAVTACDTGPEDRRIAADPVGLTGSVRVSELEPGAPTRNALEIPYDESEWTVYAGQQLYAWLNCAGCHANGGGGIGPPLADEKWIYGSEPLDIFATIWQGRPNGMPAFGNRIGQQQAWLVVAYVRSLARLTPPALWSDPVAYLRGESTTTGSGSGAVKPASARRPARDSAAADTAR